MDVFPERVFGNLSVTWKVAFSHFYEKRSEINIKNRVFLLLVFCLNTVYNRGQLNNYTFIDA